MKINDGLPDAERVTVVGAGVTGRAVVEYLDRTEVSLFVTDQGEINRETRDYFLKGGIDFEEGGHTDRALDSDCLIVSPGVPPESELMRKARARGLRIMGEIELGCRLSPSKTTVAVTGTNGKTTTVELIETLLNLSGRRALGCGNTGDPFIGAIPDLSPSTIPVVEVSSYQLQYTSDFSPDVAVLLNIEPDHLKRHGTFNNYREAKLNLFRNQGARDYAVVKEGLHVENLPGGATVRKFERKALQGIELPPHQEENLGAAITAAECVVGDDLPSAINPEKITETIDIPHRLEPISVIGGKEVINDSKATNPSATIAALDSFTRPIHLLLGGKKKNAGYDALAKKMSGAPVEKAYLFGDARTGLGEILSEHGYETFTSYPSMEKAVVEALGNSRKGEVVLFSPACSSFDQFSSFRERGTEFTRIVKEANDNGKTNPQNL
ncbi:MAG: Mur ligase family protein [Candidatus Acetothermia bacterium]